MQSEPEQKVNFEEWVNLYTDDLLSWALHKTGAKEIAEDLVQETFLAAYVGLDKFEGRSKPKTWLFSILNFKLIDFYRAKKSKPHVVEVSENQAISLTSSVFNDSGHWNNTHMDSTWQSEEHLLDDPDFNEIMDICLDDLPPVWRTAITAKYILQKKGTEICQELGITTTNYWQIVHRAKLMLKICLDNKWPL